MAFRERALFAIPLLGMTLLGGARPAEAQEPSGWEKRVLDVEERVRHQDDQIARLTSALEEQRSENRRLAGLLEALSVLRDAFESVHLTGFIQADAVLHRQSSEDEVSSTGEPLNQDRFSIPRANLRAEIDKGVFAGALEVGATTLNGPSVKVIAAEVSARVSGRDPKAPPILMATLGLFKIPYGVEVPQVDPDRFFLERSTLARALFPGTTDVGVRLLGGYRFLRYAIAFQNGEPIGEASFPGRDPNKSKDVVGRLGIDTKLGRAVRVFAGASALVGEGFHKGTPTTKDTLVYTDRNGDGIVDLTDITIISGSAATPSSSFPRFAVGGDLGLTLRFPVLGDLCLYGEITRATNLDRAIYPADPVAWGRDLRELGYYVGLTQELTAYGQIGVRYDFYNPDADASEQRAAISVLKDASFSTWAFAAAVRYGAGRLVFEYDRNQNHSGRTVSGVPTNLADDAFTLRGEVRF